MPSLKVFTDEYLPEVIIDRESEQERIRDFLQDLLKDVSRVLCIYGKPGGWEEACNKAYFKPV